MRYTWDSSAYGQINVKAVSAQTVGVQLEKLRASAGPHITTQQVVDVARPAASPMHPVFEWRDPVAAEEWRNYQARQVLRCLRVEVQNDDGQERQIIANVHIVCDNRHGYMPALEAATEPDYHQQVLDEAWRYLEGFRRRYGGISALAPVFDAMESLEIQRVRTKV